VESSNFIIDNVNAHGMKVNLIIQVRLDSAFETRRGVVIIIIIIYYSNKKLGESKAIYVRNIESTNFGREKN
jgi:hypothetical protein